MYKCAVSVAGVADLPERKGYSTDYTGSGSETVEYWRCVMGAVFRDKEALVAVSPRQNIRKIKIPVMLMHGADDVVVSINQSGLM